MALAVVAMSGEFVPRPPNGQQLHGRPRTSERDRSNAGTGRSQPAIERYPEKLRRQAAELRQKQEAAEKQRAQQEADATAAKKAAFLEGFGRSGTVLGAAQLAGMSVTTASGRARIDTMSHYRWLNEDPDYVEAFAAAVEESTERMELEARRRATAGVEEPLYWGGRRVMDPVLDANGQPVRDAQGNPVERAASIRRYSDVLLMFLLKGQRPQKYRDQPFQARVAVGQVAQPGQETRMRTGPDVVLVEITGGTTRMLGPGDFEDYQADGPGSTNGGPA